MILALLSDRPIIIVMVNVAESGHLNSGKAGGRGLLPAWALLLKKSAVSFNNESSY